MLRNLEKLVQRKDQIFESPYYEKDDPESDKRMIQEFR